MRHCWLRGEKSNLNGRSMRKRSLEETKSAPQRVVQKRHSPKECHAGKEKPRRSNSGQSNDISFPPFYFPARSSRAFRCFFRHRIASNTMRRTPLTALRVTAAGANGTNHTSLKHITHSYTQHTYTQWEVLEAREAPRSILQRWIR